jgi:hypothetical protein
MNLRHLIILSISISALCFPVPLKSYNDGNHIEKRAVNPGIKAGLVVTLSIAGLFGATIGLVEYLSTVYNRFHKQTIAHQSKLEETAFRRERASADRDFRNAGNDIVLNLVEKYVDGKEGRKGGKRKSIVEERNRKNESHEKVDNVKDAGEDLPLPKLLAFPPLLEEEQEPPPMYELVEKSPANGLVKEDVKSETESSESNEDNCENQSYPSQVIE